MVIPRFRVRTAHPLPDGLRHRAHNECLRIAAAGDLEDVVVRYLHDGDFTVRVARRFGRYEVDIWYGKEGAEQTEGVTSPTVFSGAVHRGTIKTFFNAAGDETQKPVVSQYYPAQITVDVAKDIDKLRKGLGLENSSIFTLGTPVLLGDLAIRPDDSALDDLPSATFPPRKHASQYKRMRPTQFTGMMRKVVQLVMGYGTVLNDKRQWVSEVPEAEPKRHPSRIKFSFGFKRTHGLLYSTRPAVNGAKHTPPIVIELTSSGMRAWVLPCLTSTAPKDRLFPEPDFGAMNDLGGAYDAEGMAPLFLFDMFSKKPEENRADYDRLVQGLAKEQILFYQAYGFVPLDTGEPTAAQFSALRARGLAWTHEDIFATQSAGKAVKDLASGEPYFDDCGWAFSKYGAHIVNTSWVEDETTYRKARYCRIDIGAPGFGLVSQSKVLGNPFAGTSASLEESWLLAGGLVAFPTADVATRGPQFLRSIGYRPLSNTPPPAPNAATDAVVYAYFNGDAEVRIRTSAPAKSDVLDEHSSTTTDDRMVCGVGTKVVESVTNYVGRPSGVYTTEHDDRRLRDGAASKQTTVVRFHGWNGQNMQVESGMDSWATVEIMGGITSQVTTETTASTTYDMAVHIPAYDREAYFYGKWTHKFGYTYSQTSSVGSKPGFAVRRYYLYDPFWIWCTSSYLGGTVCSLVKPDGFSGSWLTPGPKDGVPSHIYKHYEGMGWIECDPPIVKAPSASGPNSAACAGPFPSGGPRSIPTQPHVPPANKPAKSVPLLEEFELVLHRSGHAPQVLLTQTNEVAAAGDTAAHRMQDVAAWNAVTGATASFVTVDALDGTYFSFEHPVGGMAGTIAKHYGSGSAYTTTLIGVAHGIRD